MRHAMNNGWLRLLALVVLAAALSGCAQEPSDEREIAQTRQAGGWITGPLNSFRPDVWPVPAVPPVDETVDHIVFHRSLIPLSEPVGPLPTRRGISSAPTSSPTSLWRVCDAGTVYRPAGEEVSDCWEMTADEFAALALRHPSYPGRTQFLLGWGAPLDSGQQPLVTEWDHTANDQFVLGRFLIHNGQQEQGDRNILDSQHLVWSDTGVPFWEQVTIYCVPGRVDKTWDLENHEHQDRAYWQGDEPAWRPNEGYQRALELLGRPRFTVVHRDRRRHDHWRCANRAAATSAPLSPY